MEVTCLLLLIGFVFAEEHRWVPPAGPRISFPRQDRSPILFLTVMGALIAGLLWAAIAKKLRP